MLITPGIVSLKTTARPHPGRPGCGRATSYRLLEGVKRSSPLEKPLNRLNEEARQTSVIKMLGYALGGSESTSRGEWLRKSILSAFPTRGEGSVTYKLLRPQGALCFTRCLI